MTLDSAAFVQKWIVLKCRDQGNFQQDCQKVVKSRSVMAFSHQTLLNWTPSIKLNHLSKSPWAVPENCQVIMGINNFSPQTSSCTFSLSVNWWLIHSSLYRVSSKFYSGVARHPILWGPGDTDGLAWASVAVAGNFSQMEATQIGGTQRELTGTHASSSH